MEHALKGQNEIAQGSALGTVSGQKPFKALKGRNFASFQTFVPRALLGYHLMPRWGVFRAFSVSLFTPVTINLVVAPFQGFGFFVYQTQGVALGYHLMPRWGVFHAYSLPKALPGYHLMPRWGVFHAFSVSLIHAMEHALKGQNEIRAAPWVRYRAENLSKP